MPEALAIFRRGECAKVEATPEALAKILTTRSEKVQLTAGGAGEISGSAQRGGEFRETCLFAQLVVLTRILAKPGFKTVKVVR